MSVMGEGYFARAFRSKIQRMYVKTLARKQAAPDRIAKAEAKRARKAAKRKETL